jgi:CHAD domain-containing protein
MKEKLQLVDNDIRRFAADSALHFIDVMFQNAEGTRRGEDPESLHDMRVASRRLRESIRLFGRYFPPKKTDKTVSAVKKVTRILGIPREMDVNVASLRAYKPKRSQLVRTTHEYLLEVFEFEQARRRERMLEAFDKLDLKTLEVALVQFARSASDKSPEPSLLHDFPRDAEINAFLDQAVQGLDGKAAPILDFHPTPDLAGASDEELHRLRISVKKYRYCLEILSPLFPDQLEKGIDLAKKLQEVLGQIHDLAVLIGHLNTHRLHLIEENRSFLEKGCQKVVEGLTAKKESLRPQVGPAYATFLNELHKLSSSDSALRMRQRNGSGKLTDVQNPPADEKSEPDISEKKPLDLLESA